MDTCLFHPDGSLFVPTGLTRGPWTDDAQHGGPPCALLAHAVERECRDADLVVSRLTVDLFKPVPLRPLTVRTQVLREGRRIRLVDATLECDGQPLARGTGLLLRRQPGLAGETTLSARRAIPPWSSVPLKHLSDPVPGDLPRYHAAVEMRRIDPPLCGEPVAAWMRLPLSLMPGVPLTPLTRTAALADFASAMGVVSRSTLTPFINADVNITLHREPEGEWLCLESAGRGDHDGIASSSVHLHDSRGLFGHVLTTGMAMELPPLAAWRS